jgi:hypothetical protein
LTQLVFSHPPAASIKDIEHNFSFTEHQAGPPLSLTEFVISRSENATMSAEPGYVMLIIPARGIF